MLPLCVGFVVWRMHFSATRWDSCWCLICATNSRSSTYRAGWVSCRHTPTANLQTLSCVVTSLILPKLALSIVIVLQNWPTAMGVFVCPVVALLACSNAWSEPALVVRCIYVQAVIIIAAAAGVVRWCQLGISHFVLRPLDCTQSLGTCCQEKNLKF